MLFGEHTKTQGRNCNMFLPCMLFKNAKVQEENGTQVSDEVKVSSCIEKGIVSNDHHDEVLGDPNIRGIILGSYLRWVYLDQSNVYRACFSWIVFISMAFVIPVMSHLLLHCPTTCDADHMRPYYMPAHISLSLLATLSFICLSRWDRQYGWSSFLFLDKVNLDNLKIQQQMQATMKLILRWGLPCFLAQCAYKIWWYVSGLHQIPYYGEKYTSSVILCMLDLCSWLYRTSIFFLVCVLFRLICNLQILRVDDLASLFQKEIEVETILLEHKRIRKNLGIISHRFRCFILASLLLVTAIQFNFLLMATKPHADVNVLKAGNLAIVSITLLSGLFILLRSATKITHKAQSITALAAKWHIHVTINSFDNTDEEKYLASSQTTVPNSSLGLQDDEVGDEEDELDNIKLLPIYTHDISFQKRQALVTYMENNRAGISVFGFMLDRTCLYSIFPVEMALCLWLLNKTIGI